MKKFASIALIAAGVLVFERVCVRFYDVWWVRSWPLHAPVGYVSDGLGRQLTPAPEFASRLFGNQRVWIGWDMLVVDVWQFTAAALCAYLLLRVGVLYFEKSVLKKERMKVNSFRFEARQK